MTGGRVLAVAFDLDDDLSDEEAISVINSFATLAKARPAMLLSAPPVIVTGVSATAITHVIHGYGILQEQAAKRD